MEKKGNKEIREEIDLDDEIDHDQLAKIAELHRENKR